MRVALVTGVSRGLGSGVARRLWDAGFSVVGVARDRVKLEQALALRPVGTGQTAVAIATDLAEPDSVETVVRRCREEFSRIDLLVNNAAVQGPIGPLATNDWAEWVRTIQMNLLVPAALCKAVVPWMQQAGGGSIVNISGGGATGPRSNFSAYGSAKAALVRFSETLAEETRSLGIRVNCVAPGAMKTAMLAHVLDKGASAAGEAEISAAKRVLESGGAPIERVADLIVFLASDAARSITGKLISAVWDPWESLAEHLEDLTSTDIYTLRRITPKDRGKDWGSER